IVIVAHAGTNAGHFVGCNANADAAAADQDATFSAAGLQRTANRLGKVRVIRRLRVISPQIDHLMPQPLKITAYLFLQGITCMVGADGELHRYFPAMAGSALRARSSRALARATTLSSPNPSFSRAVTPGEEAPKRSRPITSPWRPTYFHQHSVAPASMASLGR